jgi:eukaryotic-like serine/threonine-protein kinase
VSPPSDANLPELGDAFAGKYTLVRVVGEGGMGIVYEAQHERLRQRVAIKILRDDARTSVEWLARFDREARAAVRLRGPNVARVFDVDSLPDGTPYMVMELLEGNDLANELAARGRLPVEEAVGYMLEACSAMAEAHALGIIHRDLTPGNLFLSEEGGRRTVKIVDFGISKLIDDRSHVTATDAAFGTPHYVSPEQIRSSALVDARTDVWSLGVILFQMLSGELPFKHGTAAAVVAAVVADAPVSLRDLRPDLPKRLVAAVMKALAKNPAERHASVEELAAAIAPFCPGWRTPSPPARHGEASSLLPSPVSRPPVSLLPTSTRRPVTPLPTSGAGWSRSARRGWLADARRGRFLAFTALGTALAFAGVLAYRARVAADNLASTSSSAKAAAAPLDAASALSADVLVKAAPTASASTQPSARRPPTVAPRRSPAVRSSATSAREPASAAKPAEPLAPAGRANPLHL